ncbi:POU domain class 2-associating factor 1 [Paramormyrops kingsleyae]|uniref:POU class 2 homeobox associating factor 1 n=1 Tax=Paramormyrops kingsleyae TaxID=1676925 RepID=A0A3B3Q5X4_9TELE|nr:POU domain class 2-associating factor 1 [Paramormyrops kingsleyae]XP_023648166.1 POU domain class 2-associating factor 1 [Paramormyrops kingsleyae]XP_023648167.1 POU domain class 2-associating factor 1 [Paramormyrops kingsleyae]XP_023648168.1 POU domain class 2-associating factor 1 [Paramormyrops kingsleyae]XP_023648169.1 POU domain class 2-associating factor 1 [Paramormyrops kingsleyae]XP_023648170.1 POU domain class 2-associating factor 1 [Paramormyrops kingsleyae]
MHWEKSASAERTSSKPYQGVRVKDPVKELLRRKRGNDLNSAKPAPATAVVVPNTVLSSYPQIAPVTLSEAGSIIPDSLAVEEGTACSGWIAQPAPTTLQSVAPWPCAEYLPTEHGGSAYASDMYVQPMCPSYTVVGPPSVLTYTHTPLFTNFASRPPPSSALPQLDLPDSSVTYLPWAQPLATFSTAAAQCPPCTAPFLAPPTTAVTVPELQRREQAGNSLPLEKLLEEDDDKDTYMGAPLLFIEDV